MAFWSNIAMLFHTRKKAEKYYFVRRYRASSQETLNQKNNIPILRNIFKLGSDQTLDAMSA